MYVYFALHPKFNPVPNNVLDKCLLNETFSSPIAKLFIFTGRKGKGKKGGKRGLLKQPNC